MRRTRDPLKLLGTLERAPWEHDYYALLRQFENLYAGQPRIGLSHRPQDERLRLGQNPSLDFAPAALAALKPGADGQPPRLLVNFAGLLGPNGPLPLHLTEFARERLLHHGDESLVRFLDLLHHRPLSLFYRAWAQAQPTVSRDRPQADRFADYVGALAGIGTPAVQRRDAAGDDVRRYFSGWLSRQVRNADGLRSMLSGFFRLPVRVAEFVGHWMTLPPEERTRIGLRGAAARLGHGAVLGAQVWDRQHKIRLVFGPLPLQQFERFLPGGSGLPPLVALMRHYLGGELSWDLQLLLDKNEVPQARLSAGTRLGRTSWLGHYRRPQDAGDLVLDPEGGMPS